MKQVELTNLEFKNVKTEKNFLEFLLHQVSTSGKKSMISKVHLQNKSKSFNSDLERRNEVSSFGETWVPKSK